MSSGGSGYPQQQQQPLSGPGALMRGAPTATMAPPPSMGQATYSQSAPDGLRNIPTYTIPPR